MKKGSRQKNIWGLACIGGLLSVLSMLLLCLTGAKLLEADILPIKSIHLISLIILSAAALLGTILPVLLGKRKRLPCCLISATVYFLSLAILNGVLQKGTFSRIGETAAVIYGTSILFGLLTAGKKKRFHS